MRFGVIRSVSVTGGLVRVEVKVSDDIEQDVPVFAPLGVRYSSAELKGANCILFDQDGPNGEPAALPGGFMDNGLVTQPAALKGDVDALQTRVGSLETNFLTHVHAETSVLTGTPLDVALPNNPVTPTTPATIVGSDPLEVS
jgi:hypothetical protein